MDNTHIVYKISEARDDFGVISADSMHKQLGTFSADDWQQAAKIFPKDAKNPDGFYIEDNNGKVNIHNDLSQAKEFGNKSLTQHFLDDAKIGAEVTGIGAAAAIATTAGFGTLLGLGVEGTIAGGLADAAMVTAACATGTAETIAIGGALAAVGDVIYNSYENSKAQNDIKNNGIVSQ